MTAEIDYESVAVPEDKDPKEYTYAERRAEILERIRDAGHPKLLNQAELGRRYGCNRSNIHNDIEVLGDYIAENLSNRHALVTESVFQKCLRELIEEGEWRKAAKTVAEYSDWAHERHELAELAERVEAVEEKARSAEVQRNGDRYAELNR